MSVSQTPAHRAWLVTFAGLGVNLLLGTLYAWGVMGKALAMQWHWTKTQAVLPFAVSTAAFARSQPVSHSDDKRACIEQEKYKY